MLIFFLVRQTSALDAQTEAELMRNINSILQGNGRTSIFIAHRLRTVVEAGTSQFLLPPRYIACLILFFLDLIIVLRDGQVAEQGTHEELLRLGGLYYSMWIQQASAEDITA